MRTLIITLFLLTVLDPGIGLAQCDTEINCNPPILTCDVSSITFGCEVTGNGPFTFLWLDNQGNQLGNDSTITISMPGEYTLEVTDNEDCTESAIVQVQADIVVPVCAISIGDSPCSGDPTMLSIDCDESILTYVWSVDGVVFSTSAEVEVFTGGVYCVEITSSNGCVNQECVQMSEPPLPMQIDLFVSQQPSCANDPSGMIVTTVTGGVPPYDYIWSNGMSLPSPSGLLPGTYSVTVIDEAGCEATAEVTLDALLEADAGEDQVVYCEGSVEIGTEPIYLPSLWISGDIAPIEFSDNWGSVIDVESTNAYVTSVPVESDPIQNPDFLHVYLGSVVAQNGDDICIPVTIDNFENVVGMAFTVNYDATLLQYTEATNFNGNIPLFGPISVFNFSEGFITVNYFSNDLSPSSLSDGATLFEICFTVIGDPQDFSYEWSGPNGFSDDNPITTVTESGIYTLHVTNNDIPNCWAEDEVVVNFIDSLIVDIGDTLYYCESEPYTIASSVQGGSGNYEYTWITGEAGPDITVTPSPGEQFFLWVNDGSACTGVDSVVMMPAEPVVIDPIEDIFVCEGEIVQIVPIVSGGVPDYTYAWSNGGASSLLIVNASGTYSVTITDENGCSAEEAFSVLIASSPTVTFPDYDPICPGDMLELTPEVSDGSPAYFYQWSNGATTPSITVAPPVTSSYTVTVTDVNGCTTIAEVSILVSSLAAFPSNIECNDNGTPSDASDDTFTFDLMITGGVSGGWTGLIGGEFSSASYGEDISFGPFPSIDGSVDIQIVDVGNPACALDFSIAPPECNMECDIEIQTNGPVCNDNGTPTDPTDDFYTFDLLVTGINVGGSWAASNGQTGGYGIPTVFGPFLATEDITIIIFDENDPDCTETITIQAPDCTPQDCFINPIVEILSCDDNGTPDEFSDDSYEISFLVNSINTAGSTYTLEFLGVPVNGTYGTPLVITETLDVGSYDVTIVDDNDPSCEAAANVVIDGCYDPCEDVVIDLNFLVTNTSCFGSADGCIEVIPSGGTPPYTFSWNFGATANPECNLPAGFYEVTVTDVNGCVAVGAVTVQEPPALDIEIIIDQHPTCETSSNGILSVVITGGVAPYAYTWATGETISPITNLAPGIYSITVVDVNGCSIIDQVELVPLTIADAGPDMELNCLTVTAILDASGSSTGPEITYEWTTVDGSIVSGGNTINPVVDAPGTYQLTVTNTSEPDCYSFDEVIVTTDFPPEISVNVDYISCDSANIFYSPTVPNSTANWTLPDNSVVTNENPLGANQSGLYSLEIIDLITGCVATADVEINLDPASCTSLSGRLVRDTMPDCIPFADEPGLANWLMVIEGEDEVYYAVTQTDGYYEQHVPAGIYEVYPLIPDNNLWLACEDSYTVELENPGDMEMQDIPVQEQEPCPQLWVDFSMPLMRACWTRTLYIQYCNDGTTTAEDAYIEVTLDENFTYQSSSVPIIGIIDNTYTLDIGSVDINECGTVTLTFVVSCDVTLGQALCAEAKIFPNDPCFPESPLWSGASLQVTGNCEADAVTFLVENIGASDMPELEPCIVIEDGVMLFVVPDSLKLDAGDSYLYEFPRNGATYRLEIDQVPYHPGFSQPMAIIEGCGENEAGTFSTGFVNQLPMDDVDDFIDIECREVVGSYDPNDKHGFPRGYGEGHYIYPGTELEYLVNFQNTGNDTAFLVVIRDTLSEYLDITTVRPSGASHPYTWDIDGDNVLVFTFENILLPDSTTNLEGSQGFIEYKVAHKEGLPLGTIIENSAAIYFDINEPVITNTTFHEINVNFIEVINMVKDPSMEAISVEVIPNPAQEEAQFILDGWPEGASIFELYNSHGQQVMRQGFHGASFQLQASLLPEGLYFFRLLNEESAQISGQIMIVR
ncbi:MAG: cohesin domain-containing protein [Chitinophagales bacterium]|nr:cohesin domain-containing protein [Chitinophagales bacterium]